MRNGRAVFLNRQKHDLDAEVLKVYMKAELPEQMNHRSGAFIMIYNFFSLA